MGAVYPRAIETVYHLQKCGSLSSCDRGLVHDLSFPTVVRYRSYRFCARCYCRCEIISITCVRNYRSLSQDGSLPSCQRGRETLRLPGSVWGIVLSLNVRSETGRTSSGSGSGSAPTNQPHHLALSLGKGLLVFQIKSLFQAAQALAGEGEVHLADP